MAWPFPHGTTSGLRSSVLNVSKQMGHCKASSKGAPRSPMSGGLRAFWFFVRIVRLTKKLSCPDTPAGQVRPTERRDVESQPLFLSNSTKTSPLSGTTTALSAFILVQLVDVKRLQLWHDLCSSDAMASERTRGSPPDHIFPRRYAG